MILKEKIKKEAEGYGKLAQAFIEGASFALENQWISVKDELPPTSDELIKSKCHPQIARHILVLTDEGFVVLVKPAQWKLVRNYVTHWTLIPELPKE